MRLWCWVVLLCLTCACFAQVDENDAGADEKDEAATVRLLVEICKQLEHVHLPYIVVRNRDGPEGQLLSRAVALGHVLAKEWPQVQPTAGATQAEHSEEHRSKTITCEELRAFFGSNTNQEFEALLRRVMDGDATLHWMPLKDVLGNLTALHETLVESGVVNDYALAELSDIQDDLKHLLQWSTAIRSISEQEQQSMKSSADCQAVFSRWVSAVNSMAADKVPAWVQIHDGVSTLVQQCHEDLQLKDEL